MLQIIHFGPDDGFILGLQVWVVVINDNSKPWFTVSNQEFGFRARLRLSSSMCGPRISNLFDGVKSMFHFSKSGFKSSLVQ